MLMPYHTTINTHQQVATFTVYEDFMTYAGGIYKYSGVGKRLGLHAVKVLGFGEANGTQYWVSVGHVHRVPVCPCGWVGGLNIFPCITHQL